MLQISKYFRLTRSFPRAGIIRFSCEEKFECKNPPVPNDSDELIENIKKIRTPNILQLDTCHAAKGVKLWRGLFFCVCVPALICVFLNFFSSLSEERKRMKFVEFSYLRLRRKPFPWDPDRSLFHNPRYNALPSGYEEEVPEEEEYDPFDLWRW